MRTKELYDSITSFTEFVCLYPTLNIDIPKRLGGKIGGEYRSDELFVTFRNSLTRFTVL
jgi:hypothetical protein